MRIFKFLALILAMFYGEIICTIGIFASHFNLPLLCVVFLLYSGMGAISATWIRVDRFSKPMIYMDTYINSILTFSNIYFLFPSVSLLVLNWKVFLLVLTLAILFSKHFLYKISELLLIIPAYSLKKRFEDN